MPYALRDHLDLSPREAETQWRAIVQRRPVADGESQVAYVPVETLLCAAAMLAVEETSYGTGLAKKGPRPIPELAALFRRPRRSITSKMANLSGGMAHGGKNDRAIWRRLSTDNERLFGLYLVALGAARAVGIGPDALPDFLGIENADSFVLLGQDELDGTAVETILRDTFERYADAPADERPSERQAIWWARVGQHKFAKAVLRNCGWECVFCGFSLGADTARPLLRASHIKPWRASSGDERRDVRNGVAACPTHDAAFDAGDLTLERDLSVVLSGRLRTATNAAVRVAFTAPVLRRRAEIPAGHSPPRVDYVEWHRTVEFVG